MGLASQLALCLLPASFKPPCHRLLWRSADRLSTASIWCLWRSNGILPHISAVCKNTLAPVFKKAQFCYWVLGQWVLRLFFFFFPPLFYFPNPCTAGQERRRTYQRWWSISTSWQSSFCLHRHGEWMSTYSQTQREKMVWLHITPSWTNIH